MLDAIIGSVVFEFIGASLRWCVFAIVNPFRGKEVPGFKSFWEARKRSSKSDLLANGFSNTMLGLTFVLFLLLLLIKLYK